MFKFPTHPREDVRERTFVVQHRNALISTDRGVRQMVLRLHEWKDNIPVARDDDAGTYHEGVPVTPGYSPEVGEKSGGSVDYYQVDIKTPTTEGRDPYTAECNDIIEALGMNYAEGNAFKALWRSCAERTLGKKKAGGDSVYDAEKMVFFSKRVLVQRKGS